MTARKKSVENRSFSDLFYYNFQIPFTRIVFRTERKTPMSKVIRILLGLVVVSTFVANILFMIETTKLINREADRKNPGKATESLEGENIGFQQAKTPGYLDIQVYSSKENASVLVNGKLVSEVTEENRLGINVVVLNQATGVVMATRSFDTYSSKEDSTRLIQFVNGLADERILCFAVKDEASTNLKKSARSFLKNLGSSFIFLLKWRDMWAFVTQRVGNENIIYTEGFQHSSKDNEWSSPVFIHTSVPLRPDSAIECNWKEDETSIRRKEFCNKYEGYPEICKCEEPISLRFDPPPLLDGRRIELPVLVMAGNRPQYLYRMLKTLKEVQGLIPSMVTIFIDGFFDEPAAISRVFGLRFDQHEGVSRRNARIAQHYKKSLTTSFDRYPDANFVVILEEDLDVSVDILSYFKQLLPVLDTDDSLYCISAWNDQGYTHTVKDPAMLYRVETMPGLGWVLSRKLYKGELEDKWPKPNDFWDWDMWMRQPDQIKGRECIIPDISRTFHFGAKGLNVNPFMQDAYFTAHALNTQSNVKLNVGTMYQEMYEKEIGRLLRTAELLDHSKTPCTNPKNFVPFTKDKTYALYFRMDNKLDFTTWYNVARCTKIWDLDARGFHNSLWRMWFNGNHIVMVGCPASPYCAYKPDSLETIYMPKSETRPPD